MLELSRVRRRKAKSTDEGASGEPSLLELSRVRRRKTKSTDEQMSGNPSLLELSRVRRRKAKPKPKDRLGFRIGSVLGKHIAHRCLLDKIEQDGRIDVLAILFNVK